MVRMYNENGEAVLLKNDTGTVFQSMINTPVKFYTQQNPLRLRYVFLTFRLKCQLCKYNLPVIPIYDATVFQNWPKGGKDVS